MLSDNSSEIAKIMQRIRTVFAHTLSQRLYGSVSNANSDHFASIATPDEVFNSFVKSAKSVHVNDYTRFCDSEGLTICSIDFTVRYEYRVKTDDGRVKRIRRVQQMVLFSNELNYPSSLPRVALATFFQN